MKAIRVLLADSYTLVRAGTRALIAAIDGVEVIAETGDGNRLLRLIEGLRPDVVLLELTMPGLNECELLEATANRFPEVRIIVLNLPDDGKYSIQALRAGAAGCLHKSAKSSELEQAIKTVSRGETYVSEEISKKAFLEFCIKTGHHRFLLDKLTPRQREILTLIAKGYNTKGVGLTLNISVKTVESHRAKLQERLDIHDIAGLVRYAIRMGLSKIE